MFHYRVGEEWAGWVWCVIGLVALSAPTCCWSHPLPRPARAALLAFLFLINGLT
jgi:hypothetical protein